MNNPTLTKAYTAGAAVAARRIVKWGDADNKVAPAAAATDAPMGVSAELSAAAGGRVDVHRAGIAEVEYGGAVTRGDFPTAAANGKAVRATPDAGVNNGVIGLAEVSGVADGIGAVPIAPSTIQGAA